MEDILKDFLAETGDQIEAVGAQLVQFEREPSDGRIIASIFRLVHSIKGTCGFLGLPRLANLAHSAETLIGKLRDGAPATSARVSVILAAIDRIRHILNELDKNAIEPKGTDADLIAIIETLVGDGDDDDADASCDALSLTSAIHPPTQASTSTPDEPVAKASGALPVGTPASPAPATIRVAVGALERIMMLVSELVLTRNQLLEITRQRNDDTIKNPLQRLSSLTTDLQDSVMRARMQPIGRLFANLPRLVRELSADLNKKIDLVAEGSDTELDRQLIELIRDPLTHMIRNCADHGIETPQLRRAAGKPETGLIRVCASHEAGNITIEITDDGRGLDVDRIRAKALALGLASEAELSRMSNDMLCRYIFAPGFSTAAQVTSVSGRGVGMDVVRENIESIGGTIALSTTLGRGTTFVLKIPLTLAIAPALIVQCGKHRFALPQTAVLEAVGLGSADARVENVQGAKVLRLRDQVLPISNMSDFLRIDSVDADNRDTEPLVVVLRVGSVTFGVIVDGVSDVQEIVVKPLGPSLAHLSTFSGNTILGDGSVVLILDPMGLARALGVQGVNEFAVAQAPPPFVLPAEPRRLILFRAGRGALKTVPLSFISRIESASTAQIVETNGMRVIRHQNGLMPLIDLCDGEAVGEAEVRPVLVIGVGGELMGLLVSSIVDIIEDELDIEIAGEADGVIGTSMIRNEPVDILDITHYMRLARPSAFSRGHAKRFRILVVDDKLFFRDMLAPIVSAAGYDVSTANSAADALQLLDKGAHFDAIVTDIDMPEMDGYAFARALHADERRSAIPILALAAHAAPAVLDAAHKAGMRGAVGKFDRNALIAALSNILEGEAFNNHAIETRVISGAAA